MFLPDVQRYDVLQLTMLTITYWWRHCLSNGGNLFILLILLIYHLLCNIHIWTLKIIHREKDLFRLENFIYIWFIETNLILNEKYFI